MTPLDEIREAARESRDRECVFLKEPYPFLNQIHLEIGKHDSTCTPRTELGQWREMAVRACSALNQIQQGDPYVQRLRPELYGHAMALAKDALAAVAEKLRRGR